MDCDRFTCGNCNDEQSLGFDFTMAFQPIVNCRSGEIFGYEALVRGLNNESAYSIISRVNEGNRYIFDQQCRIKAIELAARLQLSSMLSINFLPNAVYKPERCIKTTLDTAKKTGFPTKQIMFEFTEGEKINDSAHVKKILEYYDSMGFKTAIDDFGAGYAGLGLLSDFQTDIVKIDMGLIRGIDQDQARQTIVKHSISMLLELGITPLAEGIETPEELRWLQNAGVELMQGYLIAKPGFEMLPEVNSKVF